MKNILVKGASLLLAILLSVSAVGLAENEGEAVSAEQAGMTVPANAGEVVKSEDAGMNAPADGMAMTGEENNTFKPSDYTLDAKDEYVYEFMGLKFKLSEDFKKAMTDKKVAMLDDQSPIYEELTYAMLTFSSMTEEQKNTEIDKMGDDYQKWQDELERVATIGIFKKGTSEEEISKLTKCDTHKKLGDSTDGNYECYVSTNSKADSSLVDEFNKTEVEIIEKKERPENGFVLSEKSDLENTIPYDQNASTSLKDIVTKDINGNEFTGKDFEKYDLTMVNVFATWCTACIQEIPDLAKLHKELEGKNVNIVGIVTDTVDDMGENAEAIEKSKIIQEKTGAEYSFLMPDESNFKGRLNGIQALPETFFVDKDGNIVGDTYSGAKDINGWKETIEKELANLKNK